MSGEREREKDENCCSSENLSVPFVSGFAEVVRTYDGDPPRVRNTEDPEKSRRKALVLVGKKERERARGEI